MVTPDCLVQSDVVLLLSIFQDLFKVSFIFMQEKGIYQNQNDGPESVADNYTNGRQVRSSCVKIVWKIATSNLRGVCFYCFSIVSLFPFFCRSEGTASLLSIVQ